MKRHRSRAYPVLGLAEALQTLRRAFLGREDETADREVVANRLGYASGNSGAAARKVAALAHYGFVKRQAGGYSLSPAGREVLSLDDEDPAFQQAMQAALTRPAVFAEALSMCTSQAPESLEAALRDRGIAPRACGHVAETLRRSARFAGVDLDEAHPRKSQEDTGAHLTHTAAANESDRREGAGLHEVEPEARLLEKSFSFLLPHRREAELILRYPADLDNRAYESLEVQIAERLKRLREYLGLHQVVDIQEHRRQESS